MTQLIIFNSFVCILFSYLSLFKTIHEDEPSLLKQWWRDLRQARFHTLFLIVSLVVNVQLVFQAERRSLFCLIFFQAFSVFLYNIAALLLVFNRTMWRDYFRPGRHAKAMVIFVVFNYLEGFGLVYYIFQTIQGKLLR